MHLPDADRDLAANQPMSRGHREVAIPSSPMRRLPKHPASERRRGRIRSLPWSFMRLRPIYLFESGVTSDALA